VCVCIYICTALYTGVGEGGLGGEWGQTGSPCDGFTAACDLLSIRPEQRQPTHAAAVESGAFDIQSAAFGYTECSFWLYRVQLLDI